MFNLGKRKKGWKPTYDFSCIVCGTQCREEYCHKHRPKSPLQTFFCQHCGNRSSIKNLRTYKTLKFCSDECLEGFEMENEL